MEWITGLSQWQSVLAFCAAACALVGGFSLWRVVEAAQRKTKHRSALHSMAIGDPDQVKTGCGDPESKHGESVLGERVIAYIKLQSTKIALGKEKETPLARLMKTQWIEKNATHAGLKGFVSKEGFASASVKLALLCAAIGAGVGLFFSPELSVLLALVGMVVGWRMPRRAVTQRMRYRAQEMEHHLPEMLDVMALGMRSGLSFDESLKMYSSHFKTMLAQELANAQRQWSSGLERRDEALRKVAASYDSSIFGRIVEMIIRSIRFGSSMVESLEAASAEARSTYRARREEEVAKAPVKMMVPTGTLILPAMLIMVLGPVLLELAGGGF